MGRFGEEYNLKNEDVLKRVESLVQSNGKYYETARIRCVAVQAPDGTWSSLIAHAAVYPLNLSPIKSRSFIYEQTKVALLEGWIAPKDLVSYLGKITETSFSIPESELPFSGNPAQFRALSKLHNQNDHSIYPGIEFRMDGQRPQFYISNEPLLSFGTEIPFYPEIDAAVKSWLSMPNFHGLSSDGRLGGMLLFLPECRARISKVRRVGQSLQIEISGEETKALTLHIKGSWQAKGKLESFDVKVTTDLIEIPSEGAEEYQLFLIGNDNYVYDYVQETTFYATGAGRLLEKADLEIDDKKQLLEDLSMGEGERIEFKSFIDPDDTDLTKDVIETVISFANTKGGRIYIGVDDSGVIKGIEKEMSIAFYKSKARGSTESGEWYVGRLKKLIADNLSRTVTIQYLPIEMGGNRVLTIAVSEGSEKPYFWMWRNLIYVRHGSSDVVAHPYNELPKLLSAPISNDPFGDIVSSWPHRLR